MKKFLSSLIISLVIVAFSNVCFAKTKAKAQDANKETLETPAVNLNFETKKLEIFAVLNLDAKQQLRTEKIYNKYKDKIIAINSELVSKTKEKREIKLSSVESRDSMNKVVKLSEEIQTLYQKRDKIHNQAMKKFEGVLKKDQKKTWQYLKLHGVRLFPELDTLILTAS